MLSAVLHSVAVLQRSVLVCDGGAASMLSMLAAGGLRVVQYKPSAAELSAGCLAEHDAVIVRSATQLGAEAIRKGATGNLRVIGRAGVGVDNIDTSAAREHGLWVLNTAGASTGTAAG
jgi:D-3-phosphoglycerate dehydrogenase